MAEQHIGKRHDGDSDLALPDRCTGMYCDSHMIIYQKNVALYTWSEIYNNFQYSSEFCLKCPRANTPNLSDIQKKYLEPDYELWQGFCDLPSQPNATYPVNYFDTLTRTKSVKTKLYNHVISTVLTTQTRLMPNPKSFNITVTGA
ncbi:hypothetical protein QBC36DRAFT_371380 [Triangularia setosa]|uniref:Uncharacterized protein n=1 Tax=Triangularia setosa TaxID=2587417 RepID=A0AAN6WFI7_9PEZI|nr:hypothetical protein QBC36DRAFT_371380 [Podospora setosa]